MALTTMLEGSKKQLAIKAYRWLYFSHFRCAPMLRLARFTNYHFNYEVFLLKSNGCYVVYHSIPKTGCTTIKTLLLDAIGHPLPAADDPEAVHIKTKSDIIPENSGNFLKRTAVTLRKNDYGSLPDVSPDFEKAFHFTFVRNPWARLVSCYKNKVVGQLPCRFPSFKFSYPRIRFERMTFPDFVRFVYRVPNDLCEPHFRPQSDFFNPELVDFVGHMEHFSDNLTEVITRSGLDERLLKWAHTKINETGKNSSHYTDFYTNKTRDLIARKYAGDINRFGYRFGD